MTPNWHFDLLAPLYERLIRPPDAARLAHILNLPTSGWMLDAGGGTGRVASQLSTQVGYLALSDLSQPMLREAAAKHGILPAQARVERLPFPDDFFARVLVVDAFHHFGDQSGAIRELARVLAPGGRLVIEEPDIARPAVKLIALGETLVGMGSRFRRTPWTRDLLAANGLRVTIHTADATVWLIGDKA